MTSILEQDSNTKYTKPFHVIIKKMKKMKFKKLTFFFTLLFVSNLGYSQIAKGTIRIGPDLSYFKSTQEIDGLNAKFKSTNFDIGISGGYYIINNLEIGLNLNFLSTTNEVGSLEEKESGTFIGPSVTYMISARENFYIPVTGGFGMNSIISDDDINEIKFSGLGFGFGIGLEYLIENKIGARFLLGFNIGSLSDNDSTAEIDFADSNIGIGFNIYFSK